MTIAEKALLGKLTSEDVRGTLPADTLAKHAAEILCRAIESHNLELLHSVCGYCGAWDAQGETPCDTCFVRPILDKYFLTHDSR